MSAEGLFIVAITFPDSIAEESHKITSILEHGEVDMVHIRKPSWSFDQTERLIREIPEKWHPRLKLHDHFNLLERYCLAGVHLNGRNPIPHPLARSVSKSCHDIEQLKASGHYDYITLSPIFDSISKPGYRAAFDLNSIAPLLKGKKVVALGGVTPDKFGLLRKAGFFGAAMLGHFWK